MSQILSEKNSDPELKGGIPIDNTLTYGHDSRLDSDGPTTVADDKETKRIMRKVDLRLLPVCSLLYLFSFLDRTAIGNANVAGMSKGLGLTYPQYAMSLSFFFITYGLFEVPSNLMMKRYGAKVWLPIIVLLWGLAMLCTGFVTNFAGLVSLRMVLGLFEAGLFPGVTALLSFLYPRAFIQVRIGIFFSAATIAGAFGGLLAYGLARVQVGSYAGWRWIFIVEGLLTLVVGVIAYFTLISSLQTAKFLTEEEKHYMSDRLRFDGSDVPMNDAQESRFIIAGLLDWKTWLSLISYMGCLCPLYSVALTLPTILKTSLGYDAIESQLMTVPIYAVAAVCTLIFAYLSDKFQNRTFFLCFGTALSAIGWGVGLSSHNPNVRYGMCFVSATGSYAGFPSVVAVLSQNVGGKTKRATALAVQIGIGGMCGIISSNIFLTKTAPRFEPAYKVNCALNVVSFAGAILNFSTLYLANKRKQAKIDSGEAAKLTRQQLADMGDTSPYFRYRY